MNAIDMQSSKGCSIEFLLVHQLDQEKNIFAGYPCRPHFFCTKRRI